MGTAYKKVLKECNEFQEEQLVSWLPNSKYHTIQKAVEKLPHFAEMQEKYGLTEEEGAAIYAYTTNLYKNINPKMREGNLTKKDLGFISVVEQGLSKLSDEQGAVYRRVDLSDKLLARYQIGKIVTEKAFTSASKNQHLSDFDGYIQFIIESKSGKLIRKLSKYQHQFEVLFKGDTRFLVTDRQEDKRANLIKIYMKEVE